MYPGFEHKLLALIQECAMEDKVLIAAEQHKYSQAFRSLAPQIACSASRREVTIFYICCCSVPAFYIAQQLMRCRCLSITADCIW